MKIAMLVLWSILLGALRVYGEKGQFFQAFAHGTVFSLFTAWRCLGGRWRDLIVPYPIAVPGACLWLGIGLSALEIACFIASRLG